MVLGVLTEHCPIGIDAVRMNILPDTSSINRLTLNPRMYILTLEWERKTLIFCR